MANPPRLEAIEGQVADARYHIDRTSFRVPPIEHGWIRLGVNPVDVDASFLYFEKADEATEVHRNLSRLKGESFLRSHFVIESQMNVEDNTNVFARTLVYKPKTCFWVAVEKIDNTLDNDIIRGMCQIHQEGLTHGVLQSKHVVIIKERAKFAYITNGNADSPATDFTSLKNLFNIVLGQVGDIPNGLQHFPDIENVKEELKHFHLSANVNDGTSMASVTEDPLTVTVDPIPQDETTPTNLLGTETIAARCALNFVSPSTLEHETIQAIMEQAKQNEQKLENMIAENERLREDLALEM
ncbi:unnamed protein product [Camellia sinensis]